MHGRDHSPGGSDPFSSSGQPAGNVLSADGVGGIQWAPGGSGGGGVNDPWIRHAFYASTACNATPDAGLATGNFSMSWGLVHRYDGNPYPDPGWITLQPDHAHFALSAPSIVEFTVWLNPDFHILIPAGNDKSGILFRITAGLNGYNGGTTDAYEDAGLVTTWVWAGSWGYPPQDAHRPVIRGSSIVFRNNVGTTSPLISVAGGWEGIDGAWLGGTTPSWRGYLLAKKLSPW